MPSRLIATMTLLMVLISPATAATPKRAPAFTQTAASGWINSEPLTMKSLRGQVVLIDFWTFACWNCYRSFPWLNGLEASFDGAPFQVIGIHSPEFDYEHDRDEVIKQAAKFGLQHPVMLDNDFRFWRAMDNRYWPAFYLIDAEGRVRHTYIGETHDGDKQAQRIEADIRALLAEAT